MAARACLWKNLTLRVKFMNDKRCDAIVNYFPEAKAESQNPGLLYNVNDSYFENKYL